MQLITHTAIGLAFAGCFAQAQAQACEVAQFSTTVVMTHSGKEGETGPESPDALAAADAVPGFGFVIENSRLADQRGGSDTVVNEARLSGVVSGNSAINVVTGSNVISSGSFANASGIPVVIQNSGANVLIQNATVINLQLR